MNTLIAIAGLGIICLIAEIFNLRKAIVPVAILGLLATLGLTAADYDVKGSFYNNMIVNDNYGVLFSGLFIVLTVFLVALSPQFHKDHKAKISDFVAIKLFLLAGAVAMVTFGNLAMFFLGIEVLSIALYVLAASQPKNIRSNEAGMKYFIMGSFASGIILFGIALIYGATATFDIAAIFEATGRPDTPQWFFIGMVLMSIGLLFKVAAVPFHFWAPDVYEGSPALTTATMSTLAKVAAMAAFFKLMKGMNHMVPGAFMTIIMLASVLSMTVGNLLALKQDNVKRMLAFSGISHAGFMLLVFFNPITASGTLLYYAAAYALAGIAAFAVIMTVCKKAGEEHLYNFNGLGKTNPLMAAVLTAALLSMGGIPIFSGFFAKLFVFSSLIDAGRISIVIIGVINSIISIGYYFKLILAMYTKDATEESKPAPVMYSVVAVVSIALNIALGLFPSVLTELMR